MKFRRLVSVLMICALCLTFASLFRVPSFAMDDAYDGGPAMAYAGMMLLGCGVVFSAEDALKAAAHDLLDSVVSGISWVVDGVEHVATTFMEALVHDIETTGQVLYQPGTQTYKHKITVSDPTWTAVRSYVAAEYDPGEIFVPSSSAVRTFVPAADFVTGEFFVFDSTMSLLPLICDYYNSDGLVVHEMYTYDNSLDACVIYRYLDGQDPVAVEQCPLSSLSVKHISTRFVVNVKKGAAIGPILFLNIPFSDFIGFSFLSSDDSPVLSGVALPGLVDNPNCDYVNGITEQRDLVLPLVNKAPGSMAPSIDLDNNISLVPADNVFDELVDATPEDITTQDATGVPVEVPDEGNPIADLFVPSEAELQAWMVQMQGLLSNSLGFLWQCWEILLATLRAAKDALSGPQTSLTDWSVTMPSLEISGEPLYAGGVVKPFETMTAPIWSTLHTFILAFGDAAVLYALVNYGVKKYHDWFGSGGATQ